MSWFNTKKAKETHGEPFKIGALTPYEIRDLKAHLYTSQIELTSEVFVPFISRLKHLLNKSALVDIYETRFVRFTDYLKALSAAPAFQNNQTVQRKTIARVTLLGGIRCLLYDLPALWLKQDEVTALTQTQLMMRIPPNFRLYLSPENWRSFELQAVAFGTLTSWVLNADFCDYMPEALGISLGEALTQTPSIERHRQAQPQTQPQAELKTVNPSESSEALSAEDKTLEGGLNEKILEQKTSQPFISDFAMYTSSKRSAPERSVEYNKKDTSQPEQTTPKDEDLSEDEAILAQLEAQLNHTDDFGLNLQEKP